MLSCALRVLENDLVVLDGSQKSLDDSSIERVTDLTRCDFEWKNGVEKDSR